MVLIVAVSLAAGLGVGYLVQAPPRLAAPVTDSATGAASVSFELVDQHGRTVRADDFRGLTLLVFFGYTHCPDICPTTLLEMRDVKRGLGPLAARFRGLFITVDPERDTPERMDAYVQNFDPELVGLTGSAAQVRAAAASFGAVYERGETLEGGGYLMGHTAFGYLVDDAGAIDTVFPYGASTAEIETAVRALLEHG